MKLLAGLKANEPRMEALELFSGGLSADFAGPARARLAFPPSPPPIGRGGRILSTFSSGDATIVRYAVSLAGSGGREHLRRP